MLRKIKRKPFGKRKASKHYGKLIAVTAGIVIIAAAWQPVKNRFFNQDPDGISESIVLSVKEEILAAGDNDRPQDTDTISNNGSEDVVNEYIFTSGDSLAKVLQSFDIGFSEVYKLTKKFPDLEKNLRPGQLITWTVNDEGHLQSLVWTINRKETRIYELTEEDGFEETIEMTQGEWRPYVIHGEIGLDGNNTFIGSAQAAGMTVTERYNAARFLEYQVSFKTLRVGDKFSVLVEREFVNNEHMSSRLLAARMRNRGKERYAIYFEKYRGYYDEDGAPLAEGFLRIPTQKEKQFRISSHFNPTRLHPVTRRIAPHNGVDFAMPIGTPLVASADGEVLIARFSSSAGNYVAIRHGRQYSTRYMHMSKLAVKPGQIVKRGDIIGYSGNTGRSTGPHLHYEFLVNNRPVNPMTINLPRPEGLKGEDMAEFKSYYARIEEKLSEPTTVDEPEVVEVPNPLLQIPLLKVIVPEALLLQIKVPSELLVESVVAPTVTAATHSTLVASEPTASAPAAVEPATAEPTTVTPTTATPITEATTAAPTTEPAAAK